MSRIEKLTDSQIARMADVRDEWIAHGLSTLPANRPEAERWIAEMYRSGGLKPPERIVWCGSPLSNGLVRAVVLDKKAASVGASVRASVRASVGDSVGAFVWASVGDSVWDSVRDSVWDSVRDSVGDSVGAFVRDSVRDSVEDSVRASVRDSVWDSGYGQHDAGWVSFYDYFRRVTGLMSQTEKLVAITELSKNAGWYLPHKSICWVSERHSVLNRDERGRLHSLTAPAVMYPDGWAIYAVHGVRVPEYVVARPKEITTKKIEDEGNAEVRRVMIERYGQDRYLIDSGAKQLHKDEWGTLYRKELPNDEPLVMVKVRNSTPEPDGQYKDYFLRVPPQMETARQAVAWSFGKESTAYVPRVET